MKPSFLKWFYFSGKTYSSQGEAFFFFKWSSCLQIIRLIPFYRKALGAVVLGGCRKKDGSVLKFPMLYHTEIYNKDAVFTEKKFFLRILPPAIHPAKVWCQLGLFDGMMGLKKMS